ncbi:MAG: AAA family ATPase, partial [Desulfobacterales bacterium]
DYTAVGDTTNLAARLQQAADPGQIVISETTYQMIQGFYHTQFLGELSLKGAPKPIRAWEIISDRGARTRLEIEAERGLTPFVGREQELTLLKECFDKARTGQGQMVFIVGEPGIGKSRLLHEFHRQLGAEADWLEGHSVSFGWSIAYHPLIDLLKRDFHIEENDTEDIIIVKVERGVLDVGEELRPVLPYLRYLLAVDPGDVKVKAMDPQLRRMEIFDALRRLILRAAEFRPQVVVFEDLHWMDQATEFYLRFITDSIPAGRVLCILTYRPGYINPIEDRTFQSRIALDNLSTEDSLKMATSILSIDRLPQALQTLIAGKAEGNPFFVEEVVKTLRETGVIRRSEDSWILAKAPDEVLIPDTIQDVIMARIDRLEEAPKKTLQLAAVIGRTFTYRLLDRLTEIRGKTESFLQELKALELIYEKDIFPELAYMFKHALTQDVAYNSLLARQRRRLHRLIARAIEDLYADRIAEQYEVLAFHFANGHEWEKALEYFFKAAQKAVQSFANREALDFYDQALKIVDHLGSKVDLKTRITIHQAKSDIYLLLSDFGRSRREGESALDLAHQTGDRISEGQALISMGHASRWIHEFDRSLSYARQAVEIAGQIDADSLKAGGYFISGAVHAVTGHIAESSEAFDRSLAASQSAGDAIHESFSLNFKGLLKNWRGEFSDGIKYLRQGLRVAQAHNLLVPYCSNLFSSAIALTGNGDYDQALTTLEEGLAVTEKAGAEVYHLRMMNTLGWLYLECGDLPQALIFNQRAAEGARKRGDAECIANAQLNLGDTLLAQNDLGSARETFEEIYRLVHDPATSDWMKWRYRMHLFASYGELQLARGDLTRAGEFAEHCLDGATRTGSRKYLVKGWRLKGEIAAARRQWDEAQAAFRQALSIAESISNPTQLWKTHFAMGRFYTATAKQEKARVAYRTARDVIDHVKAGLQHPDLQNSLASDSLIRRVYELSKM